MARTYPRGAGRKGRARTAKSGDPSRKRPVRLPPRAKKRSGFSRFKSGFLRFVGIALLTLFVAGVCASIGGYVGLVKSVGKLKPPEHIETHPTYIYSAPLGNSPGSRRVIGTIFEGENRKTASLRQMPSYLLNAAVAKEDARFREHAGVDVWGIIRALYADIRAGHPVQGASTITQQYVRNAYLTQAPTLQRKIKEALIATQIETVTSKDQILADYLNTAYFGNNAYGVEAASETYFNKSVGDLTLGESATLIGLVWSPSVLGQNERAARYQRNLVLYKMFNAGYINRQDYEAALKERLPSRWPEAPMKTSDLTGPQLTRNFTQMVRDELIRDYGASTVLRGGLTVDTTLDLKDQQAAEDVLYGPNGYLASPGLPDGALVSIDQHTGEIKAMVGNRDQSSQFNLATQARRQPGSSFKPFAFIAALQQGVDPNTHFVSENKHYAPDPKVNLPGPWSVKNYALIERGSISLEEALWQSDNTVFADLVMDTGGKGLKNGPQNVARVAESLGIPASNFPKNPQPSIVLGSYEVSPLQQTTAYATIANDGKRVEPTAITKVVENAGQPDEKVLMDGSKPSNVQAISPAIAHEITGIMEGDLMWGIAGDAALNDGQPIAGKTGTSENYFDSWFIGFSPQLTTGIWLGYGAGGQTLQPFMDQNSPAYGQIGSTEQIFHDYMTQALAGKKPERFPPDVRSPAPPTDIPSTGAGPSAEPTPPYGTESNGRTSGRTPQIP